MHLPGRVLRGLVGLIVLSFLNLAAALMTLAALGGLGEWTPVQFVGVFGIFEAGTGLAAVVAPNAWRLPVVAAQASSPVVLSLPSLITPHWAALVKVGVGGAMIATAAIESGVGAGTAWLLPVVLGVAVAVLGLSLAVARLGVARPELDVVELIVRRPRREDRPLRAVSLGGAAVQMLITLGPLPSVKLLSPEVLYQPVMQPGAGLVASTLAIAIALALVAVIAWRQRLALRPPREQAEIEIAD